MFSWSKLHMYFFVALFAHQVFKYSCTWQALLGLTEAHLSGIGMEPLGISVHAA